MKYILLFLFSFYIHSLFSQEDTTINITQNKILSKKIKEVVITGQLTEKYNDETVHKVHVITSKQLNSGLFIDLGQVLEKELNMKLLQDNVLGSNISIQGISGENVKILIDDIPVIGRLNGNIDLSQISLKNIDRIEIIEGALSTLYGTDALAGTVNIITKKEPDFSKSFSTYYESIGKYNFDYILAKQLNNQTITYQFERNYFNGWSKNQKYTLLPTEELANENRFKTWKPKEQFINKLQYNIKQNNLNIYNYIEHFSEKITNRGLPRAPYLENAFDEYYYTNRMNLGSNINLSHNHDKIKILLAYNRYNRIKETFYKDLTTLVSTLVEDPTAQDTSSFNLILGKAIISNDENKNLQYQFGIEGQTESVKGDRIKESRQVQSDYALFGTIEYKPNDIVTLRPSARAIHNTKYTAPFIPSLNILLNFSQYQLRFGLAKGFRAPSLKELHLDFVDINHNIVGNKNLKAETSSNYQINNSYKRSIASVIIKTDVNIFYNIISNKINLTKSSAIDGQYSYFNIEEFKTKGISTSLSIASKKTSINIGLSHIGRYNRFNNNQIPEFNFTTDYNMSAILTLGKKHKINIFYKYVGKVPSFWIDENNIIESHTDAYKLLDISINRRLNDFFIISLGAKNLLNITSIEQINSQNTVHNSSNNNIPISYGRSFFIQLNLNI